MDKKNQIRKKQRKLPAGRSATLEYEIKKVEGFTFKNYSANSPQIILK
jgi:hypothetical protein